MDHGTQLERAVVAVIIRLATSQGLNHVQFARLAFVGDLYPEVKWRQIRNVSKAGKPQRLTLGDAARCAAVLGQSLADICCLAVENGEETLLPADGRRK